MRQIYPDLWQTSAEHPLSTYPNTLCHAYLLIRETGNVLFYSTGREAIWRAEDHGDHDRIEELGGVGHMLLAPLARGLAVRHRSRQGGLGMIPSHASMMSPPGEAPQVGNEE